MASVRHRLQATASKLHKWLALIIGAQLSIWFASGALMSWWPIDEIHGDQLVDRNSTAALTPGLTLADPRQHIAAAAAPVDRITPRMLQGRAVAEVALGQSVLLYDAVSGQRLPPVSAAFATAIIEAAWRGKSVPTTASRVAVASTEYRGPLPARHVEFADPDTTRVFVAADSGQITAVRTGIWRLYDFVWGLHIMDWQNHDNFNSWWLLGFAIAGLVLGVPGTVLLVMRWPLRLRRRAALP